MRQLVAAGSPDAAGRIFVRGEKYSHLRSVMRARCGDMLRVRLEDGSLLDMTVAKIDEACREITLETARAAPADGAVCGAEVRPGRAPELFLFQFIAKPSKMDIIVRQAAECGVSRVIPVEGEYCQPGNVESARVRGARWRRIIREAREQSGSTVPTEAAEVCTLDEACGFWRSVAGKKAAVALWEREAPQVPEGGAASGAAPRGIGDVPGLRGAERAALAVGAEGGISAREIALLSECGFVPVHLDTNILRCETAALYGIAVLQSALSGA